MVAIEREERWFELCVLPPCSMNGEFTGGETEFFADKSESQVDFQAVGAA